MRLEGECCAKDGDYLKGETYGLLKSTVSPEEMDLYMNKLKAGFGGIIDTLSAMTGVEGDSNQTVEDLKSTISNLARVTQQLDFLLARSSRNLDATFANMASISGNLKDNNEKISGIIDNTGTLVSDFKDADFKDKITALESNVSETLSGLDQTLQKANQSFENLNMILAKINAGEGLLGQLTQDQELYDKLTRVSSNLDFLLQDLRLNPKRYINVSVFGKKQKDYEVPENDPAYTTDSKTQN